MDDVVRLLIDKEGTFYYRVSYKYYNTNDLDMTSSPKSKVKFLNKISREFGINPYLLNSQLIYVLNDNRIIILHMIGDRLITLWTSSFVTHHNKVGILEVPDIDKPPLHGRLVPLILPVAFRGAAYLKEISRRGPILDLHSIIPPRFPTYPENGIYLYDGGSLFYYYRGHVYNRVILNEYTHEEVIWDFMNGAQQLMNVSQLQSLIHNPIFIKTKTGNFIILDYEDDQWYIYYTNHLGSEREPILTIYKMSVPNLANITPNRLYSIFPNKNLERDDGYDNLYVGLHNARFAGGSFRDVSLFDLIPNVIYKNNGFPTLTLESMKTLIERLYGLPFSLPNFLVINELQVPFIPFSQIADLLKNDAIHRHYLDPLLQPWAGLPSSPNRIIMLLCKDGTTYLGKVRYENGQMYPPTD